jgi:signal transduction histidine kinase
VKGEAMPVNVLDNLPRMMGDKQRLNQVFLNLISNALRHTQPGCTISTEIEVEEDNVVIRVQDTGSGIPQEELPHVFDRFYRADPSRTRTTGGSGLDLTIAKQIVMMHGGKIWVQSWVGAGSTFGLVFLWRGKDHFNIQILNIRVSVLPAETKQSPIGVCAPIMGMN